LLLSKQLKNLIENKKKMNEDETKKKEEKKQASLGESLNLS
jgi:hypothetical protein